MMRDRGYNIPKSEVKLLSMSESQFLKYHKRLYDNKIENEWTSFLVEMLLPDNAKYTKRTILGNTYTSVNSKKRCIVIYVDQEGGQQVVKAITDAIIVMVEGVNTGIKYDELVLITQIPFSVSGRSSINDLKYTKHWIFFDYELCRNVTKHKLVPEHTLLSEEDTLEFKKRYRHPEQISVNDPVVKYYGWKIDQVIMIKRDISSIDSMVRYIIAKRLIVDANIVNDSKK